MKLSFTSWIHGTVAHFFSETNKDLIFIVVILDVYQCCVNVFYYIT